jgi:hypothetical protein
MNNESAGAVDATRHWIESIVIGLHLCPFAAAPFNGDRIRYQVSQAESVEAIYQDFLALLYELFTSDPAEVETALLILDHGLADFDAYLDAVGLLDAVVAEAGAEGLVQIASFHPDYRFDGAAPDDPANYTNRSPYPMFHLIREDGLAAALESVDDPHAIPARNVERLRALGIEGIRKRLEQAGVG